MPKGLIRVATCQFAECYSPARNAARVIAYMQSAKDDGAHLVHFHEAAMTGYLALKGAPPLDAGYWAGLANATRAICDQARRLKLWVVLGSAHRLTPPNKPTNCLYVIGPDGRIRDRYDKRFCTAGDLNAYTPGDRFVMFDVNGVKCS